MAFLDETGSTFRARPATTWAPIGHPKVVRRVSKRREVSNVVALTAPLRRKEHPRLYARHFQGSIQGAQEVQALKHFRRKVGQPLLIVWDGLQTHRSKQVRTLVATHPRDFRLEWLPPYAPDLNPEEGCNSVVKAEMRNALPASEEQLRAMARRGSLRLQHRPELLRGFFRRAHLLH